jgi:hypothetical protein
VQLQSEFPSFEFLFSTARRRRRAILIAPQRLRWAERARRRPTLSIDGTAGAHAPDRIRVPIASAEAAILGRDSRDHTVQGFTSAE